MKSSKSKVLHEVAGRPMISHVIAALEKRGVRDACTCGRSRCGPVAEGAGFSNIVSRAKPFCSRNGAALAMPADNKDAIARDYDDVIVAYGDAPLVSRNRWRRHSTKLAEGADVVVIGFQTDNPTGCGRLLAENGELVAIREEKDATDAERKITFCNSGLMAIDGRKALALLDKIDNNNAKGEYYLTDIVEIAGAAGGKAVAAEARPNRLGCNNRAELADAREALAGAPPAPRADARRASR